MYIQVACKVTGRCIEMMGGVGFVKNFPVEKFYRDAKIGKKNNPFCDLFIIIIITILLFITGQIYEGTTFIQLNTISDCIDKEFIN